jgi:hypothetical protein
MTTRIAMWSGPRNISTAMMRSWGSRADTFVTDEPLYAHYLLRTGLPHPGREATVATQEADWRKVAGWLTGPIPEGRSLWYQKHMSHHLLPGMEGEWLDALNHAFLIREPSAMLLSLTEFIPVPTLRDTGLPQQLALFERVRAAGGRTPPVVDGHDVLRDPRGTLGRLCEALDVPFDAAMLAWAPGLRATDGAWASVWYDKVARTTGFGPPVEDRVAVPEALQPLYAECLRIYAELAPHRLAAG